MKDDFSRMLAKSSACLACATTAPMPKNSCVTPGKVRCSTGTPAADSFCASISPSERSGSISAETMVVGRQALQVCRTDDVEARILQVGRNRW